MARAELGVRRSREQTFVASVLAREQLGRLARALADEGIVVMPLKGVLLQAIVYDDPSERPISDIDVLVPEGRFEHVVRVLRREGYTAAFERGAAAQTFRPSGHDTFLVDVHWSLFRRGLFRMPTSEVFARSTRDARLFGSPVMRMNSYDVFAHLIGHFVKGRLRMDDACHLSDFERVARSLELDPRQCARHVERCGLARAARYVLRLSGGRFGTSVVGALHRDPLGYLVATRWWYTEHVLNATLPRGARSFAHHIARSIRRRARRTFAHSASGDRCSRSSTSEL